jgi:hypothetical protein
MAQQPYMGSGLLFPKLLSRVHSWQFYRSWCVRQSHLAGSQETWVRNGGFEFSLRNIFIHLHKDGDSKSLQKFGLFQIKKKLQSP